MRKLIFTLFFTTLFLSLAAQNVESEYRQMERILANRENYITADGEHDTLEVAVHNAMTFLGQQIQTTVVTMVKTDTWMLRDGQKVSEDAITRIETTISSEVNVRESTILTVRKPDRKNSKYKVFVYVEKSKIEKMYEDAKAEELEAMAAEAQKTAEDVEYYYKDGLSAVEDLRIGDALKCWYWAYALSLGNNKIKINGQPADRVLESKIGNLLDNIQVTAQSYQKEKLNEGQAHYIVGLDIRYKGAKVTNLNFTFNDGYGWEKAPRARDGIGQITLRRDVNQVPLQCIYCYDENETPDDVFKRIKGKSPKHFSSADKTVSITAKAKMTKNVVVDRGEAELPVSTQEQVQETNEVGVATQNHKELQRRMTSIEQAIRALDARPVKSLFTNDGYKSFERLIMYGKASIVGKPQYTFVDYDTTTICRGITMQFNFRGNKKFIEKVTFRFNDQNLVKSVAFRLSDVAEGDIFGNDDWKRGSRLALVTFLEDYQTAYALGDIEYLKSIFSPNALIVLGNKLVETKNVGDRIRLVENVRYDTLSKTEFITRLEGQFATREYINLNFLDTDFKRSTHGNEIYGIRVKQEYYSNVYGDSGWLFLLVDLRGKLPVIHIRAWQNEKLPIEDLIDLTVVY